jgi:hypothetical protein
MQLNHRQILDRVTTHKRLHNDYLPQSFVKRKAVLETVRSYQFNREYLISRNKAHIYAVLRKKLLKGWTALS